MASSNKKTTMNKLNRERRLRERRMDKQARKEARKQASADAQSEPNGEVQNELGELAEVPAAPVGIEDVAQSPIDA